MNMISYSKRVVSFSLTVIILLITASCNKKEIIDPFWEIDIDWDKSTMTDMLYKESKRGKIVNCVFSFEKEFYVKNKEMDARVKASLDYPCFEHNNLKMLKYSLFAEFRDEATPKFNPVFFNFFKDKMISHYGTLSNEIVSDETVNLSWDLEKSKVLEAVVFKEINHYLISVRQKE